MGHPVDVGIFGPIKDLIETLSHRWHGEVEHVGQKLDQYRMMKDVCHPAFEQILADKTVVKSAFKKCGLVPWDIMAPDTSKLKPGDIYEKNSDTTTSVNVCNDSECESPVESQSVSGTPSQLTVNPVTNSPDVSATVSASDSVNAVINGAPAEALTPLIESPCVSNVASVSPLHSVSVVTSSSALKNLFFNDGQCEADQIHDYRDVASPDCVDPAVDAPAVLSAAVDAPAAEMPVSDAFSDPFFDIGKTICSQYTDASPESNSFKNAAVKSSLFPLNNNFDDFIKPFMTGSQKNVSMERVSPGLESFDYDMTPGANTVPLFPLTNVYSRSVNTAAPATVTSTTINSTAVAPITAAPAPVNTPPGKIETLVAKYSKEQTELNLEDRKDMLKRFELLLSKEQKRDFNDMFNNKVYNVPNTDYQAWLQYKLLSIGSEKEAFDHILSSRMPKKIPNKKTNRKSNKPEGVDRYDPLSQAWTECLPKTAPKSNPKKSKKSKNDEKDAIDTANSDVNISEQKLDDTHDNVNISTITNVETPVKKRVNFDLKAQPSPVTKSKHVSKKSILKACSQKFLDEYPDKAPVDAPPTVSRIKQKPGSRKSNRASAGQ